MNGHVQDELPALLSGELSPSAAAAVHAHLAVCDRCRAELAAVAFVTGELRSAARIPFADPSELPPLLLTPPVGADQEQLPDAPELDLPSAPARGSGRRRWCSPPPTTGSTRPTRRPARPPSRWRPGRAPGWCCSTARPSCTWSTRTSRPAGTAAALRAPCSTSAPPAAPAAPTWPSSWPRPASSAWTGPPGWPVGHGPDALAAACEVLDAERVVLPSTLAAPALIDRVRGHTLAAFRRRVPARISLADLDGTLAEVD